MASKKLSDKELQQLKDFQVKNNEIVVNLGTIELRIDKLEEEKEKNLEAFRLLSKEQEKFGKELQDNYGDGNIDLEKGEFTPSK